MLEIFFIICFEIFLKISIIVCKIFCFNTFNGKFCSIHFMFQNVENFTSETVNNKVVNLIIKYYKKIFYRMFYYIFVSI